MTWLGKLLAFFAGKPPVMLDEPPHDLQPIMLVGAYYERSPQWKAARERHLALNPECAACGTTDWPEVHHERPVHIYPSLELEPLNLLTLCGEKANGCHRRFGHGLAWQYWCPNVRREAAAELRRILSRRKMAD